MESFKDKSLSSGLFFLELLSAVEPWVVNWNLVTKGESDDEKKLNATYIISVARKLGCSLFLLPEDIMEVNQKMILTLTASIMYWSLQQPVEDSESSPAASSCGGSPEPSLHGTPSPAPTAISDAPPSPPTNGSVSLATPSPSPVPINGSLSPAATAGAASREASPEPSEPSVSEEGDSSIVSEISQLTFENAALHMAADDTALADEPASDTTIGAPLLGKEEVSPQNE